MVRGFQFFVRMTRLDLRSAAAKSKSQGLTPPEACSELEKQEHGRAFVDGFDRRVHLAQP
jgi:hypothetical protein